MSTTNKTRIRRFTTLQRFFHLMLMLAFLTQAATGLGRMYIETSWGKSVTWVFGGYEMSRTIHVYVGILMICGFLVHVVYLLFRIDWQRFPKSLAGPDSLLPQPGDIKDFFRHIAWFFGAKEAPAVRSLGLLGKIRLLGGLLGRAPSWNYRPAPCLPDSGKPHDPGVGPQCGLLDSPHRSDPGNGACVHHPFLHRPPQAP